MEKELLCNLCGESMCPNERARSGIWQSEHPHGLINAKVTGGYESYHLMDLSQYTFSFCEPCLRKLFVRCKIKPQIHDMIFSGLSLDAAPSEESSWESDQTAYEYRIWKDNGSHHQAYLNEQCNVIKNCPNKALYSHLVSGDLTEDCACEEHKNNYLYGNSKLVPFISNTVKSFL